MDKINERVRRIRKKSKVTCITLSNLIGIDSSTYSKKERCGKFSGEELIMIADFLKVDVREFFYDDADVILPHVIIPDECYMLDRNEADLLTMYRNLSKEKRKEIYAFTFNTFKNN